MSNCLGLGGPGLWHGTTAMKQLKSAVRGARCLLAWTFAACVCASVVAAATGPGSPAQPWRDPLDTPAVQSPLAAGSGLNAVTCAGNRLVAVGWRGHVLLSDDGGGSWRQARVPVSTDLTAVQFVSATLGWAVGHGGVVLRSTDGGASWMVQADGRATARAMAAFYEKRQAEGQADAARLLVDVRQNTASGADQPWLDVHFLDAEQGWVAGSFGMFMHTRDGGRSWTPQLHEVDNPGGLHLTAMASMDGDVYIASEQGTVFRRAAGSQRFVPLATGYKGTFFGILARNGVLVAYGLRGTAYRSVDQGRSWSALQTRTTVAITGGTVLDDGRVLLVSQAGELLAGHLRQDRFEPVRLPKRFLFSGLAVAAGPRAVLVGTQGVFVHPLDAKAP